MIKHLLVSSPSVIAKFVFLLISTRMEQIPYSGFLIYSIGLSQVIVTLYSQLVLVPFTESKIKIKNQVILYIFSIAIGALVIKISLVPVKGDQWSTALVVFSLMLLSEVIKKYFVNQERFQLLGELSVVIGYILLTLLIFFKLFKIPLLILIIIATSIILKHGNARIAKFIEVIRYNWSSFPITVLSFFSANIILIVYSYIVDISIFNDINQYRLLFAPIGVLVGFAENKLLTSNYNFYRTGKYLPLLFALTIFLFAFGDLILFIGTGIIMALLQAVMRLNTIFLRRQSRHNYIIISVGIYTILSIIINFSILVLTGNIFSIHIGNVVALMLVLFALEKKLSM